MTARAAIFLAAAVGMASVLTPWMHMPIKGNVYGFEINGWWRHVALFAIPAAVAIIGNVQSRLGLLACIVAAVPVCFSAYLSGKIVWNFASGRFRNANGDPFGAAFLSNVAIGPGPIIALAAAGVVVCAAVWSMVNRDSVH